MGVLVRRGLFVLLAAAGMLGARPAAAQEARASWVPRDSVAMSTFRGKGFKIVAYQYRIEFFSKNAKKPDVTLTFKHPVSVSPSSENWGKESASNILACTDRSLIYSIQDPEEQRLAAGGDDVVTQMMWENPKAMFPDFCGVIGPDGKTVFRLPREEFPGRVYQTVGITAGGRRAAVLVGNWGKFEEPAEGSEADEGLNAKEIWVWEHPDQLRKRRLTRKDREVFLFGELRAGRL